MEKKKKIGIMTFWDSNNNYGQVLQLFALQNYLIQLGHEPFLIKFHRKEKVAVGFLDLLSKIFSKKLFSFIQYKLNASHRRLSEKCDLQREFPLFKSMKINYGDIDYYSLEDLLVNPPKADVYISGSDQVWNNHFKFSAEPFLLGFGDDSIRKVSYAASLGQTYLNDADKSLFSKYLNGFDFISVRESGSIPLLSSLTKKDIVGVLDPTLLFIKQDWLNLLHLSANEDAARGKSIFIYTLGNSNIKDKNKFIDFAKSLDTYEIIHATANDDFSGNVYPTVAEWVDMIRLSSLVITTSFHGLVFCIINNVNFIVLPNSGSAAGMNDRIVSLLSLLGLEDHIMKEFDETQFRIILDKQVEWNTVNQVLAECREASTDFLKRALFFE